MKCFPFFHKWTKYGPTQIVSSGNEGPTVAQRRVCQRCDAVDYRRVLIHNG